jgi:hypothetical protein
MNTNYQTAFINDLGQAAALVSCHYNTYLFSATNHSPR